MQFARSRLKPDKLAYTCPKDNNDENTVPQIKAPTTPIGVLRHRALIFRRRDTDRRGSRNMPDRAIGTKDNETIMDETTNSVKLVGGEKPTAN